MSVDLDLLQAVLAESLQPGALEKRLQANLNDSAENRHFGELDDGAEDVDTFGEEAMHETVVELG